MTIGTVIPTPSAKTGKAVVPKAESVIGTRRGVGGTQSREAVEHRLEISGIVAEVIAGPAACLAFSRHRAT